MAVTREHNELILRAPPGAVWLVNIKGEAVLQVRRGTEDAAIRFLEDWIARYTRPLAAMTSAPAIAPAPAPAAPAAPASGFGSAFEEDTSKAVPAALRGASPETCEETHTNAIRTVRCTLPKGHGGSHCIGIGTPPVWYPLEIAPASREAEPPAPAPEDSPAPNT